MKKKTFIKGTVLPVVVLCSAMTFSPMGVQAVKADTQAVQQAELLKGTIVDKNGETIIGASIVIVGGNATQGAITDLDGNFSIKAKPGAKLKISYVGYKPAVVTAKPGMRIVLEEDNTMLQEVEVVAYGTQKKVTVTGALSSVKNEDLTRTPVSSVNNVLAGQLSGVTTVQYSGEPGSDAASIFVRGKGTFTNSDPLIQVDGVERDMFDIDPNEIESITVLKDASATAVFGVRGANGVVLITTKRGAQGKAKVSFSTSWSALTPTKMVEQANSYQYATFYNQMRANDGQSAVFSDAILQKFKDGSDPIRYPNTRWADYIMKDVTLQTQHSINVSGGTDKVRYFVSAGMFTQGGLFKEFDMPYNYGYQYQRFNYRANVDIDVTKTTTISANLSGKVDNADKPYTGQGSSGMIKNMYYATPFSSPGIVDGRFITTTTDYLDNPLPFTGGHGMTYYGTGFMQTNRNTLQMDLQLKQKLDFVTEGLSWHIKGAYNNYYTINKQGNSSVASYQPVLQDDGSLLYKKSGETTTPSYRHYTGRGRDWYFETAFNYNRSFGRHTVTGLLMYNHSSVYYPSNDAKYVSVPHRQVGMVGRVTYDWANRYMAEFNVGYNGSENFAPDKRFGWFPAGSIGWLVSEEPFFKPLKKVVSFLKLRGSFGLVGNDYMRTTRFMYLPDVYLVNQGSLWNRLGMVNDYYGYNFGIENGVASKGALESTKNNRDITWEHAYKQDYGVDINFFDDRLRTTFDYFKEHRTDIMVTDYTSPGLLGFVMPPSNLGVVDSWGWELSMKWQDKIGDDFSYWAGINISYNQNEIKEMKEAPLNNAYQYQKGHRIGARSQYKFFRFFDKDTPALYEQTFGEPMPTQMVANLRDGDAVYVDLNHDGKIDANDMSRDYGYTDDPEYVAGLNLGLRYKGFSLAAQFTAAWNVSRSISDVFRQPFYSAASAVQGGLLSYHLDHTWTVDNPSQNAEYPRATWENATNNYAVSTLYEKDSKYLRLKTLQIAYDFDFPWMKKLGMNQLQLALSGYNLFTITPYLWGDPETRASNAPSYPLQRTYTASLKISF